MTADDDGDDVHELREQIRALEFDGDTETARKLREQAERTLDYQLETLDDIDSKAMAILRVNMILIGLLLTAASLTVDNDIVATADLGNLYIAVGAIALLLSTALAAFTYTASDYEVGMDAPTIREVIQADLTEREFEIGVAQSYTYYIDFNDETNIRTAPLITLTTVLIVVALVHLSIGVYAALIDEYTLGIAIVSWVALLAFAAGTGLPS